MWPSITVLERQRYGPPVKEADGQLKAKVSHPLKKDPYFKEIIEIIT